MPVSPQTAVGFTVGTVSTSGPLGMMPLSLAGTVFTPISTGLMSPRPASSAAQAIVKGPQYPSPLSQFNEPVSALTYSFQRDFGETGYAIPC